MGYKNQRPWFSEHVSSISPFLYFAILQPFPLPYGHADREVVNYASSFDFEFLIPLPEKSRFEHHNANNHINIRTEWHGRRREEIGTGK
jgi:hypothetical protein